MERETFERVMECLDDAQDEAMARREENTGPMGEPTSQSMYFLGKDVGLARAKRVLRARVDVDSE